MRKAVAAVLVALALAGISTASVQAGGGTYVHNRRGSYVPTCPDIGCRTGPGALVRNGHPFAMRCWADGSWWNGNYNTNRWFLGYISGLGWTWVSASYVYNQVRVRHC